MALASVYSNNVGFHRFRPAFHALSQPPHLIKTSLSSQHRTRRFHTIFACQTTPKPAETEMEETVVETGSISNSTSSSQGISSSNDAGFSEFPNKETNRGIAVASALAAVGLFLFTRLDFGVSLKGLSAAALPFEEALGNGKPTVVEFYADWCEVCTSQLASDVYKVELQYKDRVNFVKLNVDNTKWEQDLDEFGVEGIPHFAFLDRDGNEEGNVVGRLSKQYFLENVDALARGEAFIPHARVVRQYSSAENSNVYQVVDPRSHG